MTVELLMDLLSLQSMHSIKELQKVELARAISLSGPVEMVVDTKTIVTVMAIRILFIPVGLFQMCEIINDNLVSISSTSQNENIPWYSEQCASTIASTYSSGTSDEKQIMSTDLR